MDTVRRNPDANVDDIQSEFDYQSEVERRKKKRNDLLEKDFSSLEKRPGRKEAKAWFQEEHGRMHSEVERRKKKRNDLLEKDFSSLEKKPGRKEAKAWFQEEHGRMHRQITRMMAMDAYSRHKELINLYYLSHPGATNILQRDTSRDRTDYDVLKDNHKFLWTDADEAAVATKYCIVDLTYFKKNKIAMRWRTEAEVRSGKGQFICGAKKCPSQEALASWEVCAAFSHATPSYIITIA
ncbi:unnamed protein product [Cylicostephanus goldi]|uniref:Uncharacterized protein n=1 Tax=Cylicostephanus goldi TaxID=71465 RepID=A0A3P7QAP4_CYLGO|nr:unnamed protein product [Cylicostephanus goldi]